MLDLPIDQPAVEVIVVAGKRIISSFKNHRPISGLII